MTPRQRELQGLLEIIEATRARTMDPGYASNLERMIREAMAAEEGVGRV